MIEIFTKNLDCLLIGLVSQFAPQFPLDCWSQETLVGFGSRVFDKLSSVLSTAFFNQPEIQIILDDLLIGKNLDA